jgi:CheY-like chemotaxis protein
VLELNQFQVTTAGSVSEALHLVDAEPFDVLLCDLHMPGAGDGFTVVSAMRHTNPEAIEHGKIRHKQGYTLSMIVEESRILQVSIFQTLQNSLTTVDFSLLLIDVMTIADEVDSQLKQTIVSFTEQVGISAATAI